jgi:hypothetical protein
VLGRLCGEDVGACVHNASGMMVEGHWRAVGTVQWVVSGRGEEYGENGAVPLWLVQPAAQVPTPGDENWPSSLQRNFSRASSSSSSRSRSRSSKNSNTLNNWEQKS